MSKTLRSTGLIVVAVFVAMGLAVAVTFLPLLIALGVLTAFVVLCFRDEMPQPDTRLRCSRERLAMIVGIVVVGGSYAAIGMITLLGGGPAVLLTAAVLAAFGIRRRHRGTARGDEPATDTDSASNTTTVDSSTRPPTGSQAMMPADPTTLSIDALCRAWRLSYVLLQKARCADELERAAELRRRYLDELAHRDPDGFRRWLDDGARAASDPSRYVGQRPDPSERDEDEDEAA